MEILKTKTKEFEVEWAAPASITDNIMFLAKIRNSSMDDVHNTFKNSEETEALTKIFRSVSVPDDKIEELVVDTYVGYTRYFGFSIDNNGDILVTLKKNLGV